MRTQPRDYHHVAIITHPNHAETDALVVEVRQFLIDSGVEDICSFTFEQDDPPQCLWEQELDLVITIGGDGTMLRASHLCGPRGIPLIGINMGRLGFLTELTRDNWQDHLPTLFGPDSPARLEQRMMLHGVHSRGDKVLHEWDVLNDLVVVRGRFVRPITLSVSVNQTPIVGYVADGLIVSSATGSTAYSLAVGGPILLPEMRNMVIIPISPHFSIDRAFVLSDQDEVSIRLETEHEAVISPDGKQSVMIENGDVLTVSASTFTADFVRFSSKRAFYRNIIQYMERNPIALKVYNENAEQD